MRARERLNDGLLRGRRGELEGHASARGVRGWVPRPVRPGEGEPPDDLRSRAAGSRAAPPGGGACALVHQRRGCAGPVSRSAGGRRAGHCTGARGACGERSAWRCAFDRGQTPWRRRRDCGGRDLARNCEGERAVRRLKDHADLPHPRQSRTHDTASRFTPPGETRRAGPRSRPPPAPFLRISDAARGDAGRCWVRPWRCRPPTAHAGAAAPRRH